MSSSPRPASLVQSDTVDGPFGADPATAVVVGVPMLASAPAMVLVLVKEVSPGFPFVAELGVEELEAAEVV